MSLLTRQLSLTLAVFAVVACARDVAPEDGGTDSGCGDDCATDAGGDGDVELDGDECLEPPCLVECPDGFVDRGDGECVPTAACANGQHDGGDGQCVPTGSCSPGYHDGGRGDCLLEGACSDGFHDLGDGTCGPEGSCLFGFHDGGTGACFPEGSCAAGYADGGDGRCVPSGTCSPGYVDGGGGICVPDDGTCADGFMLAYADGDGDGFGGGDASCQPVPLGDDLAPVGGDCDDNDSNVWQLVELWPDRDDDGFTTNAETVCVGDSTPGAFRRNPSWAPVTGLTSFVLSPSEGNWSNPVGAALPADGRLLECNPALLDNLCEASFGDFRLDLNSDDVVTGIEVSVLRQPYTSIRDVTVALMLPDGSLSNNRARPEDWPMDGISEVTYGGTDDLWGLDEIDASTLSDPAFSLLFGVSNAGLHFGEDFAVDHVRIAIYVEGRFDCDDTDPLVFLSTTGFSDGDGDAFGSGAVTTACAGWLTAGLSRSDQDCDDDDDDVHPLQEEWFDDHRDNGSYDYNCDDVEEQRTYQHHFGCNDNCGATDTELRSGQCGTNGSYRRCTGSSTDCSRPTTNIVFECR